MHPPHRRDVINGVGVGWGWGGDHNEGSWTTEMYVITLGLTSSYFCGNNICFETQNDVVSKYYPGISGNIF